jgi:hopanoid biosynthesis associated radical SAM protein HpnH
MSVPISQMATVATYVLRQKLAGRKRYPLVLMLEPLYRCNLACAGCGKIQYPSQVLKAQLSVEEALAAVDECGAPVVSIPGGEPLLHPEIDRLVAELVARRKYVYLCTNALLLEEKLDLFQPSKYLSFSVHLDGLEAEHDASVCRPGTYQTAVRAIEKALARGFRVTTNTTLFAGADPERTADFFDEMMRLGVEGMMVSPGYAYAAAPDQEHFLAREATRELFRRLFRIGRRRGARWRFNQSPLFAEFLTGARDYPCSPWSMPSYGVFGWQKPCYLLQEGYAQSYGELLSDTDWDRYGPDSGNPACRNCMVHSGFEASAVDDGFSSWRGFLAVARAALFGPRVPEPTGRPLGAAPPAPEEETGPAAGTALDATPESLRAAFRYRGDVTLVLDDGSAVDGFVVDAGPEVVRVWPRGETSARTLATARVRRVVFSGKDHTERGRRVSERGRERLALRVRAAGEGPAVEARSGSGA